MRRTTSWRGDQPTFLSIQCFFRFLRTRISDMALPFARKRLTFYATSHRNRSGGDPTFAGANERQQVPDLRDLVDLALSNIQGSA